MIKGVWQKITALLGQPENEREARAPQFADKRTHSRFSLNRLASCSIAPSGDHPLPITAEPVSWGLLDLSYGGMKLALSKTEIEKLADTTPDQIYTCLICLPDHKIPASFRIVHCSRSRLQAGCSFEHTTSDTLIQLREILEPLKTGASLRQTDRKMLNQKYASGNWYIYRGFGPTDFSVRLDQANRRILELLVNVRILETYWEISFIDGSWRSGKSAEKTSVGLASVQILRDRAPDPMIIQLIKNILLGFDHEDANHPLNLVYRALTDLAAPPR